MSDVFMMSVDGSEHEYRQVIANGIPTIVGYGANLAFSDLSGSDLSGLDLSFANLRGAELTFANLSQCNLSYADLTDACAIGADLRGANLRGALTKDVSLTMADLRGATYDRSVQGAFISDDLTPAYLASIGITVDADSTVGGGARSVLDVERATDIARGETIARGEFVSAKSLEANPESLLDATSGLVAASRGSTLARGGRSRDYSGLLEQLSEGIAELTTSEKWARYLDVQSKFHRYSPSNAMLILMQNPDATQVAGYKKWQELGRQVLAKESALRILAPMVYQKDDGLEGEKTSEIRGFKLVPVFDIAQTEGPELPEVVSKLDGLAPDGVFEKLTVFAESIGFRVERPESLDSGANGDTSHNEGRIRVVASNSEAQQAKTLAHEIGHALLHDPESEKTKNLTRGLKELEAESTAYIVCTALGLDTSDYSFGYVAGWAGGGPEAIQGIKESAGRIQKASTAVLRTFEAPEPSIETVNDSGVEMRLLRLEAEVAGNVELDSNQNRNDPRLDELIGPVQTQEREVQGPEEQSRVNLVDLVTRDIPTRGYQPLSGAEFDVLSSSTEVELELEI